MDLNRRPSEIAASAAEEIRALNHRTQKPDDYPDPAALAYTTGHLTELVQRLPQALQQIETALKAMDGDQRLRLADRHPSEVGPEDLARAVAGAVAEMAEAREALAQAEAHFRRAGRVLNGLGSPWPDDSDEV